MMNVKLNISTELSKCINTLYLLPNVGFINHTDLYIIRLSFWKWEYDIIILKNSSDLEKWAQIVKQQIKDIKGE